MSTRAPLPSRTLPRRAVLLGALAATPALGGCGSAAPAGNSAEAALAFSDRAETIARTLREAGTLASYARDVVLLEDRVIWGAFDNQLAKEAAEAGRALISLPKIAAPKPRRIGYPDKSRFTYSLLTARQAADEAIPTPCGPTERCSLSIDHAELADKWVLTNRGSTKLPVWLFTGGGLADPVRVLAIRPSDLSRLEQPHIELPHDTSLAQALGFHAAAHNTVEVSLGIGSCDLDLVPRVFEASDVVVIGGTVTASQGACRDDLKSVDSSVRLAAPLGHRPVVDVMTGAVVRAEG